MKHFILLLSGIGFQVMTVFSEDYERLTKPIEWAFKGNTHHRSNKEFVKNLN